MYHEYFSLAYQQGSDTWTHIPLHEHALDMMPSINNKLVLDIGCGRGEWMMKLLTHKARVIGIDYVTQVITSINQSIQETYKNNVARALIADVLSLPFQDSGFDMVTDIGTFQHINELDRITYINEITRTLKPGGYYINVSLSTHTTAFFGFKPETDHIYNREKFGIPYYFFNTSMIQNLFQESFQMIDSCEYTYPSVSSPDDEITMLYTLMQKKNDS